MSDYYVVIVDTETDTPNLVMGPMYKTRADRVADGAGINLNWERFDIQVIKDCDITQDWKEMAR